MLRGGLFWLLIVGSAASSLAQDAGRFARVLPGVTFQVQNRGGVDVNLFAGYRFTEKITVGGGWNDRYSLRYRRHFSVGHRRRVYGPRFFLDFKLSRGFSIRGEVERMNAYMPPVLGASAPGAVGSREWVWGFFVGAKKTFRLRPWVNGNIQLLYNLHDAIYKTSPYSDRLNLRFGFEFPLGRRMKPILN